MIETVTVQRGTIAFAAGKFAAALRTGVYVFPLAADSFLSTTGAAGGTLVGGTVEAWVKTDATVVSVAFGHDNWYWVGITAGGLPTAHYGPSASEAVITGTTPINDGQWHHVAFVLGASARSLYVDGVQVATSATGKAAGTSLNNALSIGGFNNNASGPGSDWARTGTALIDEVRVSNVERYTGSSYTVPTAVFVEDANTIAGLHLDGVTTAVLPNNAAILYSPYNWDVTSVRAWTVNAGAYFKAAIEGAASRVTLNFDMADVSTPYPQIRYRIDQGPWVLATLAASVAVAIPTDNTWTTHVLEVVVKSATESNNRWTAPQNSVVKFTGLSILSAGTASLGTVERRKLDVLVFGDSITEGVRTLRSTGTVVENNDATVGWAYQLTQTLGAEVGVVGFGRQGVTITGNGNVPALSTSYALIGPGVARSFAIAPDLILINMGTNDKGQGTTVATFKTAYTALLNALLAATPPATKIGVMVPFGAPTLGYTAADYAALVAACSNPRRVRVIDTAGWFNTTLSSDGTHPYGNANVAKLSPLVADAARSILGESSTYINVGGVAKPVGPRIV